MPAFSHSLLASLTWSTKYEPAMTPTLWPHRSVVFSTLMGLPVLVANAVPMANSDKKSTCSNRGLVTPKSAEDMS